MSRISRVEARSRLFEPRVFSSRRISCVRKSSALADRPFRGARGVPSNWSRCPCSRCSSSATSDRSAASAASCSSRPGSSGDVREERPHALPQRRREVARDLLAARPRGRRPSRRSTSIRGRRSAAMAAPSVSRMATSARAASPARASTAAISSAVKLLAGGLDDDDLRNRRAGRGPRACRRSGTSRRAPQPREQSVEERLVHGSRRRPAPVRRLRRRATSTFPRWSWRAKTRRSAGSRARVGLPRLDRQVEEPAVDAAGDDLGRPPGPTGPRARPKPVMLRRVMAGRRLGRGSASSAKYCMSWSLR